MLLAKVDVPGEDVCTSVPKKIVKCHTDHKPHCSSMHLDCREVVLLFLEVKATTMEKVCPLQRSCPLEALDRHKVTTN